MYILITVKQTNCNCIVSEFEDVPVCVLTPAAVGVEDVQQRRQKTSLRTSSRGEATLGHYSLHSHLLKRVCKKKKKRFSNILS